MIHNFYRQDRYARRLEVDREARKPAADRGMEECISCGHCCTRRTCIPTPDELPVIAEYLGITVDELISTYMVGDSHGMNFYLRFANTMQEDVVGTYISSNRTYDFGDCIMWDEGCKIYEVRPREARLVDCWHDFSGPESCAWEAWSIEILEQLCPNMQLPWKEVDI